MTLAKDKPKYYTTSVPIIRTERQIKDLLADTGLCLEFQTVSDGDGNPYKLRFVLGDPDLGEIPVELDSHHERIQQKFDYDVERARRIAWRQMKHYVETQIMLLQSGLKSPHEAFLDDALVRDGRNVLTMGEYYRTQVDPEQSGPPALTSGED